MVSLSTRSRYGIRLLMSLARHSGPNPMQISDVAKEQNISVKYLEQIALILKKAGIIETVRGRKGGHRLAKYPEEITLDWIVGLLEGGFDLAPCVSKPHRCPRSVQCAPRLAWQELSQTLFEKLRQWTLGDLLRLEESLLEREDAPEKEEREVFYCPSSFHGSF
ncbi:MAG: Rrf2 family transcriptional regulator [Desulfosoma sp.]